MPVTAQLLQRCLRGGPFASAAARACVLDWREAAPRCSTAHPSAHWHRVAAQRAAVATARRGAHVGEAVLRGGADHRQRRGDARLRRQRQRQHVHGRFARPLAARCAAQCTPYPCALPGVLVPYPEYSCRTRRTRAVSAAMCAASPGVPHRRCGQVPKGALCAAGLEATNKHPRVWPNPTEFDPGTPPPHAAMR